MKQIDVSCFAWFGSSEVRFVFGEFREFLLYGSAVLTCHI